MTYKRGREIAKRIKKFKVIKNQNIFKKFTYLCFQNQHSKATRTF